MASFMFGLLARGGEIFLFFLCLAAVAAGAVALVCFIAGEMQKMGRERTIRKKIKLENGLNYAKARDEILKRERRSGKEREAHADGFTISMIPTQRVGGNES